MSDRILGIGTDLCEIARMEKACENEHFLCRVCTPEEIRWLKAQGKGSARSFAALFAAKEAAVKALGTGFSAGIMPEQIEVLHTPEGAPTLKLYGKALERMQALGGTKCLISLSHEAGLALAFAVLVGTDNTRTTEGA